MQATFFNNKSYKKLSQVNPLCMKIINTITTKQISHFKNPLIHIKILNHIDNVAPTLLMEDVSGVRDMRSH